MTRSHLTASGDLRCARAEPLRRWLRCGVLVLALGFVGLGVLAGRASGQANSEPDPDRPFVVPPGSPPPRPPPGGFPVEIGGDRPRDVPDSLRAGRVLPGSGMEIGVGSTFLSIESETLHLKQGPKGFLGDGAILSVDLVLETVRLGYVKMFVRRGLEAGTTYHGTAVDFLGVDADQLWAFYGWRPVSTVYLGAGVGFEYRLVRLSGAGVNITTLTETLGLGALIVDWAVSSPRTVQFRIVQEETGHLVTMSGTALQLGYIVPF